MAQLETDELVNWARTEAQRLRSIRTTEDDHYAPWGRHEASAALEFLRLHAAGSAFLEGAQLPFSNNSFGVTSALHAVASALDSWASSVTDGIVTSLPFESAARREAATDLMEQTQALLDGARIHPAAPVVLAGAALEESLRALLIANGLNAPGKPGIDSYATALRKGDVLTTQDVKDITAWAGLRNSAAHGEFEKVTIERAQLMVDGINLFLRQRMA